MRVGLLIKLYLDSPLCEIRASNGDTYKVYGYENQKTFKALVLFDPENPDEHRLLKYTEDDWLELFKDYEANNHPIFLVFSIIARKLFDIDVFKSALSKKYSQLDPSAKEKLINVIWKLSFYTSKTRQNEIASILNTHGYQYTPTSEKAIISDAITLCLDVSKSLMRNQKHVIPRDLDQKDIFLKFIYFDITSKQRTRGIDLKTDNKLIQLMLWKNELADSFDFGTLHSFFYCFGSGTRWRILQKLAYEKEHSNLQVTTDDLISLIESSTNIRDIQRYYEGYTSASLRAELLVHSLDSYVKRGRFLSQGRILDILNQINDRQSKIDFGLHSLFDFCNGGLLRNSKYEDDNNASYTFDRVSFLRNNSPTGKYAYMYECLENICNGRLSTKKDEHLDQYFFWCNGYPCFKNNIHKQTDYKKYKLIDFCIAFGLKPYNETDSGILPNDELSKFIDTVSKVERITSHLYCESCKHLLFPDKRSTREEISAYNTFVCQNPNCDQKDKYIYINHCHTSNCKGVIDSRHLKKCPNGMHICPECFGCCSDKFFRKQEAKNELAGRASSTSIKPSHNDKGIFYCYKCGDQLIGNKCSKCGVEHVNVMRYRYTYNNDTN